MLPRSVVLAVYFGNLTKMLNKSLITIVVNTLADFSVWLLFLGRNCSLAFTTKQTDFEKENFPIAIVTVSIV